MANMKTFDEFFSEGIKSFGMGGSNGRHGFILSGPRRIGPHRPPPGLPKPGKDKPLIKKPKAKPGKPMCKKEECEDKIDEKLKNKNLEVKSSDCCGKKKKKNIKIKDIIKKFTDIR